MRTSSLIEQVRGLVGTVENAAAGTPAAAEVAAIRERLDEPLRVAIAGKVKAGKSTLLNALVGDELAPTDAGECTKIVTWYRDGITYRVTLEPRGDPPRQVRFSRDGGALEIDLVGYGAEDVDRLLVDWPSASLRTMTLIDTPGLGSLSTGVSERARTFLAPGQKHATGADAVLYLMRHLHTTDLRFLETFRDDELAKATPINAVAVLSRADEVSAGRLDAMESAARIAARWRSDTNVRRLCQTVIPVAGLLAQTATTLHEAEFRSLARLVSLPEEDTRPLFLTADRFSNREEPADPAPDQRRVLLERLGLFGVRLAVELIRSGKVTTAPKLAEELVGRSGVLELQYVLASQFGARRDVLKARSALLQIEELLESGVLADPERIRADLERVQAGAHEFAEIGLLNALRTGAVTLHQDETEAAERLLGGAGPSPRDRLGLPLDADEGAIRAAAVAAMSRWQMRAESPLSSRDAAEAARVLVRSCEGVLATLG